jgi:hypothetical protein
VIAVAARTEASEPMIKRLRYVSAMSAIERVPGLEVVPLWISDFRLIGSSQVTTSIERGALATTMQQWG